MTMRFLISVFGAFLGALSLGFAIFFLPPDTYSNVLKNIGIKPGNETANKVCFGNDCFFVEVADDPQERQQGLMDRQRLGKDRGMLFVFGKAGVYNFWMKNTLIPLDIVWLDLDGRVVCLEENNPPCQEAHCPTIECGKPASYVLEINAGITKDKNIRIGDRADISF